MSGRDSLAPPFRTFSVAADDGGSTLDIKITELAGVKAENLGLTTWGAAYILANQLFHLRSDVSGNGARRGVGGTGDTGDNGAHQAEAPTVLELGAGTGLAGLAAALLWRANVVLTDLPTIVPGMAANISLNAGALSEGKAKVQCGTLDWANPDHLHGSEPDAFEYAPEEHRFQVILAADTLYSEDHPAMVAGAVFRWLARGPEARFVVCYAQRVAYLDHIRELWTLLEEGGLVSVGEGREMGDASWDEEAPFEWAVFQWADSSERS